MIVTATATAATATPSYIGDIEIPESFDIMWVLGMIALVLAWAVVAVEVWRGHWIAASLWWFICVVLPYAGPIAWWAIRRDEGRDEGEAGGGEDTAGEEGAAAERPPAKRSAR